MQKNELLNVLCTAGKTKVLLATVSGAASTKPAMIRFFNDVVPAIDIITTKSFQVTENKGNPEPIICEPELGTFGNSVGLRNPGMKQATAELKALREKKQINKVLNISLSASNPADFITLVKNFESLADMLELNFSCPHAASGFGASIGCHLDIAASYVQEIKAAVPNLSVPLFVKLTPNVSNIGEIAAACVAAGADGIVAINTVGPELYLEPQSQKPILNNKLGGKGGKSGRAVFPIAVKAMHDIRKAVGETVPIIGMGGVARGSDAAQLIQAGANVVGIGSALAQVNQAQWAAYLAAIKSEAKDILENATEKSPKKRESRPSESFLSPVPKMTYIEHRIIGIEYDGADVLILKLDGEMEYAAGEFVFLWLPGVGEKPFTIALSRPLSFMIKKRGAFTEAVFRCKVGDKIYIRGLYGAPINSAKTKKAFLVAGGTGVAVLPKLAEALHAAGTEIETFIGTSEQNAANEITDTAQNSIEAALSQYGNFRRIADNGTVARVLNVLEAELKRRLAAESINAADCAFYIVGPTPFFTRAAEMLCSIGIAQKNIFLSLEKLTRCGVGLCGECGCGQKLSCQCGTFFRYDEYLRENER